MALPTPDEVQEQFHAAQAAPEEELEPIKKIHIDVTVARGKRYTGDFIFKVPNLGDKIEIGKLKSVYLPQGSAADFLAAALVEQICYLQVTLQKPVPAWWKPFELYDAAPVSRLYAEGLAYERRFLRQDAEAGDTKTADPGETANRSSPDLAPEDGAGVSTRAAAKRRTIASTNPEGSG